MSTTPTASPAAFGSSTGEVTVNGAGSPGTTLPRTTRRVGTGTLNIENGGTVTNNAYGYLGLDETVTALSTPNSAGQAWNNTGEPHVGRFGTGVLNVERARP
ncbi:MAG: hypothetical protein R3C45_17345 [Phycisphaerales bacterium]